MSKLRMSEAILAGASAIRAKAGVQHETQTDGTVVGCALGMANVANGATYGPRTGPLPAGENPRSVGTAGVWGQWVKKKVRRPCECTHKTEREMDDEAYRLTHQQNSEDPLQAHLNDVKYIFMTMDQKSGVPVFKLLELEMAIEDIIPHLFDNHVVGGKAGDGGPIPWTIEQLADWVKVVEDAAEKEQAEKDAAVWGSLSVPWPVNFRQPYYYVGIDWARHGGAVAPGNDISPYEGAIASNAPPAAATEISLAALQEMFEKVKTLSGPTEEETEPKLSPQMRKMLGMEEADEVKSGRL